MYLCRNNVSVEGWSGQTAAWYDTLFETNPVVGV